MNDLSSHGIVALVRNSEGKFLLLEDAREEMLGYWAPPHGRCESTDNSEADGVMREIYEETKLKLYPGTKIFFEKVMSKELSLD